MIYLFFAIIGLLLGLLVTRRPRAVVLEGIRLLWLVVPALFLMASPAFLAYYNPDLLWADNNRLLMLLTGTAHAALLLIVFVNIVSAVILTVNGWRFAARSYCADRLINKGKYSLFTDVDIRRQFLHAITASLLVLSLICLSAGLLGHMSVLWENNGVMPVSADYLQDIEDPVVAEGVRNEALYFKRIIDENTALPQLGQTIKVKKLSFLLPEDFSYISVPELIITLSLMSTIALSMITETLRRSRKLENNSTSANSDKTDD